MRPTAEVVDIAKEAKQLSCSGRLIVWAFMFVGEKPPRKLVLHIAVEGVAMGLFILSALNVCGVGARIVVESESPDVLVL